MMGDSSLLHHVPDIMPLLPQGSSDSELAAAEDRSLGDWKAAFDLALKHRRPQHPASRGAGQFQAKVDQHTPEAMVSGASPKSGGATYTKGRHPAERRAPT